MKQCTKCKLYKKISSFDKKKKRKDEHYSKCKRCNTKYKPKRNRKKEPVAIYSYTDLFSALCFHLNTSEQEIKSSETTKLIVLKRHIIVYLIFRFTWLSLKDTSLMVNRSDHTTAIHALNKIIGYKKIYKDFYNLIRSMQRPLRKKELDYFYKKSNQKNDSTFSF